MTLFIDTMKLFIGSKSTMGFIDTMYEFIGIMNLSFNVQISLFPFASAAILIVLKQWSGWIKESNRLERVSPVRDFVEKSSVQDKKINNWFVITEKDKLYSFQILKKIIYFF